MSETGIETAGPGDLHEPEPADDVLRDLVSIFNALDGASIDITLHVGGGVVSGDLISMAEYGRIVASQLRGTEEEAAQFAPYF